MDREAWWATVSGVTKSQTGLSQIIPPSPSPTESKRLFYASVSLLLSRIQGYCYHLSIFSFFFNSFFLFLIFKLYNIVLVLPNIEMNPPQVYMCFPS